MRIQSIPTDPRFQDLTGKSFGRLTVIAYAGSVKSPNGKNIPTWMVRCECGREKTVRGYDLKSNKSGSCGCYRKEQLLASNVSHGMSDTKTYYIWKTMIQRCTNKKCKSFCRYGGRGIKVCDQWLESFENFFDDMGPAPPYMSIDRFPNNDGNYEPGNCRWATKIQQANNTRTNKFIEFQGERLTISQWSKKTGISEKILSARIRRGWSIEHALTTKVVPGQKCHSKGSSSKTSA